ncbi:MAG: hypothetical protein ACOCXH_03955 [Cyclobacteriaceae bacterium]
MKFYLIIIIVSFLFGCQSATEKEIESKKISLSGEFLFAGPNTLQSQEKMSLSPYANELGLESEEKIAEVNPASITVKFANTKEAANVESILLQMVSEDLEMTSIGTLSPLPEGHNTVQLSVAPEMNLLPYLGDPSSIVIADVNLKEDMDALTIDVQMNLNFKYNP